MELVNGVGEGCVMNRLEKVTECYQIQNSYSALLQYFPI